MTSNRLLIISYHYIAERQQYPYPGIHPTPLSSFITRLDHLSRYYHIATPLEVTLFFENKHDFECPSIFLTFDDGLIDHYSVAMDTLDKYRIKAAFFVSTAPLVDKKALVVHKAQWLRANTQPTDFQYKFLSVLDSIGEFGQIIECRDKAIAHYRFDDEASAYLKYLINFVLPVDIVEQTLDILLEQKQVSQGDLCERLYMNNRQIVDLHRSGNVVGAHTHRHIPISRQGQDVDVDIKRNIGALANITGSTPRWIAYPHGDSQSLPDDPTAFCAKYNFQIGFTMVQGWNDSNVACCEVRRVEPNEIDLFLGQDVIS